MFDGVNGPRCRAPDDGNILRKKKCPERQHPEAKDWEEAEQASDDQHTPERDPQPMVSGLQKPGELAPRRFRQAGQQPLRVPAMVCRFALAAATGGVYGLGHVNHLAERKFRADCRFGHAGLADQELTVSRFIEVSR